jgi:hypothetical protein
LLNFGFERFSLEGDGGPTPRLLAACGHQPGFAHDQPGFIVPQARPIEIGPDLLCAIAGDGPDFEPICLGQGSRLTRFDPGSEAGQGNYGRSQKRKYRQGGERFDHFGAADFGR